MKLKKRKQKNNDQEKVDKAFDMIYELMSLNQSIEPTLWASAVWSTLVNGYKQSGFTYNMFQEEVKKVVVHYEEWFD